MAPCCTSRAVEPVGVRWRLGKPPLHESCTLCSSRRVPITGATPPSSPAEQRTGRREIPAPRARGSLDVWFSKAAVGDWRAKAYVSGLLTEVLGSGDHNHPDASGRVPLGVASNSEPDRLHLTVAWPRFCSTRLFDPEPPGRGVGHGAAALWRRASAPAGEQHPAAAVRALWHTKEEPRHSAAPRRSMLQLATGAGTDEVVTLVPAKQMPRLVRTPSPG